MSRYFLLIFFASKSFAWTFEGIEAEWIYHIKKISFSETTKSFAGSNGVQLFRDSLLCNLGSEVFLGSVVRETPSHLLRSLEGQKLAKAKFIALLKDKKKKNKKEALEELLTPLWKDILAREKNISETEQKNLIIQIATAQGSANERQDRPSPTCMSLLLGASLLKTVDFLYPFEGEKTLKPRRSARVLVARWETDKKTPYLTLQAADGIFAQPLEGNFLAREKIEMPTSETDMQLAVPKVLEQRLAQENLALSRNSKPKVVKINGAWAYVDKGRGYGLKMNDRLVVAGRNIEGHVVGYYGPEEKLSASEGYKIQEGAIVFVRKGQALVQRGDAWEYDKKRYP